MITLWKRWTRLRLFMRYWNTLEVCSTLMRDPNSNKSLRISGDLTLEEMDGVVGCENLYRLFTMDTEELKKDLKHLEEVVCK